MRVTVAGVEIRSAGAHVWGPCVFCGHDGPRIKDQDSDKTIYVCPECIIGSTLHAVYQAGFEDKAQ